MAHRKRDVANKVNAMTVDVEDYFHVSALEKHVPREDWERRPCRVERNIDQILELFYKADIKATFFVLGWLAERYPQVVRKIVDEGHELASHGYEHVRVSFQSPPAFIEDVGRTKKVLEDIGGCRVRGYRAASYSIDEKTLWALDALAETGYRYSSSIYPIRHDLYGMPKAPRFAFRYGNRGMLEIPITTTQLLAQNVPCGGGGYFRLWPYWLSRWALWRVNVRERKACVFFFHPWEIDPEQPRLNGLGLKTRVRHYLNLHKMQDRLRRLLKDFQWGRIDEVFKDLIEANP
jgi:polysaccharide deacetylase family protein (PEP-CTERM system associated)